MAEARELRRAATKALSPYLGRPTARAAVETLFAQHGISRGQVSDEQIEALLHAVGPRLVLLVGASPSMGVAESIRRLKRPSEMDPTTLPALDIGFGLLAFAVCAVFLPQLVASDSAVYRQLLTEPVRLAFGSAIKLASLMAGTWFAFRNGRLFGPGNSAGRAWYLLSGFLCLWTVGQISLSYHQLILDESSPFPSVADVFFLAGYPLLVTALVTFLRAYFASGLFSGEARGHVIAAAVASVLLGAMGAVALYPVTSANTPAIEKAINIAYPAVDLVAMVPTFLLIRLASQLRGGSVFWVWALLLNGLIAVALGDLLYAYFSSFGYERLDPVLDVMFALGYLLVARGTIQQYALITRKVAIGADGVASLRPRARSVPVSSDRSERVAADPQDRGS